MTDSEPRTIIKQAIAELSHCVSVGPQWFTKGEWGQQQHARMWTDRAIAALAELEEINAAVSPALEFRIGNLRIRHCDEPSMIWIDRDGEGGYFSLNEFHDMVQEFVSDRL